MLSRDHWVGEYTLCHDHHPSAPAVVASIRIRKISGPQQTDLLPITNLATLPGPEWPNLLA